MKTDNKNRTVDFTVDMDDALILWGHSRIAYEGYTFSEFFKEIKEVYANNYLPNRENPKTFSQWINAQILAIAY